ncbi:serine palmitoyltransferase small subunit family protein [Aspergillus luchuensis]|uniref:Uncharacterized protein n=6 Tax=Aspergillus subgen. Circumdati TaxID=2720871 RepID=A0A146FW20_ASPKA|nr:uncharacterized protein BO83DRAFT_213334 [Aspergillus eucalypticola CBS 122712]XP_025483865.1 hypothetical protein BO87DRAFT_422410 [Aspergillus neoniger CBS 115656]XP_025521307.1 hypothetical protein BO85DRAFT_359344 [Aspergillus piperis CBS 112811]XP_025559957.1 hypothetical protein BO88DRAFT_125558 [Aspergillus vadensis CBS 113365]XP_041546065.1 uncharacterized protein AKAW2_60567A [Aspergillus luchuensis]OJZ86118.1 hypothetical protein ASPFODRAFT_637360 [Aspergillus luchuensis CBS 106.4
MTLFWILNSFMRWVRLKIYQYEVTFAVYMLTPTEKFIFNSLLLTLLSMIVTGIYVYLPDHIRSIYSHLYYYWAGERPFISASLPSISSVFRETGTQTLEVMYETAKNAAATATAPIAEL